ncbi:MAG: nucleotidyltransferase family protein [Bacteroidia bacterium]|nr:MAG: nucleotidyltransferase family protein [Bacteroidia bacterium]
MKAMIFAAGMGTRLDPLTRTIPKALVAICGKPMLLHVAEKLMAAGITEIVVNVHHHADKMKACIQSLNYPGVQFHISDETDNLLDTGGGLLHAASLLQGDQPVILHNTDVVSDADLLKMLHFHMSNNALVTLAVSRRKTSRYFLWHQNRLAGWENTETGERILTGRTPSGKTEKLAFSGIHVVDPRIFKLITESGTFSINTTYLRLAKEHKILAFEHDPRFWADMGSREKLRKAEQMIIQNPSRFKPESIM